MGSDTELASINEKLEKIMADQSNFRKSMEARLENLCKTLDAKIEAECKNVRDEMHIEVAKMSDKICAVETGLADFKSVIENEISRLDTRVDTTITQVKRGDFDSEVTIVVTGMRYNEGEDILGKVKALVRDGLQLPQTEIINAMRTPHHDNKPGIVKIQFKDKDTKIAVLRVKSPLFQDERYKRVFIRSSQPHIERVAQKNTMAILREMGIDHKYRFSGNGKLVPKQPAADGTQFGPYSAAAMATFPPTGPPPNQYRGPQMGYQFQNTLPPQVPMYSNFPRPAGPTSVPPNHTHVMRPTDSLTVPSGEQAQQLPTHAPPPPSDGRQQNSAGPPVSPTQSGVIS